jgi:hypothetical protein
MWSRFSVPRAALIPRELAAAFSIFETQGMYRPGPGYRGAVSRDQHL